jgi:hypothetical protein
VGAREAAFLLGAGQVKGTSAMALRGCPSFDGQRRVLPRGKPPPSIPQSRLVPLGAWNLRHERLQSEHRF